MAEAVARYMETTAGEFRRLGLPVPEGVPDHARLVHDPGATPATTVYGRDGVACARASGLEWRWPAHDGGAPREGGAGDGDD